MLTVNLVPKNLSFISNQTLNDINSFWSVVLYAPISEELLFRYLDYTYKNKIYPKMKRKEKWKGKGFSFCL